MKKMYNFSVGPVEMDEEILKMGAEQIPYFRTDEFSALMKENESLLKKCINATHDSSAVFLTASGTGAMEATVMNLFNRDDKVLVVNGGSFGARFKQICDIHQINAYEIKLKHFEQIKTDHLAPFEDKGFTAFLINAHETSTGVLYDMKIVSDFCKRNNLLLVVDAISSFLADPYDMQKYDINATILSSQKAIALPPGLAFIILDKRAQESVHKNKVPSLYFNLQHYLLDGERGQTPYTPAVSILLQLNKRLKNIIEIGVENVINDVAIIASDFRERIKALPFDVASEYTSNTLTPITPKGKMNAVEIFNYLKNNHQIFVVPSGGALSEKLFRVGHIGALSIKSNDILLDSLNEMNNNNIL